MPHGAISDIAAGPGRTQRAIDNYEKAPNSFGAKLFAARLRAVNEMTGRLGPDLDDPHAFKRDDGTVQFYTCSTECTVFQACIAYSYKLSPYDSEADKRDALAIDYSILQQILLGAKLEKYYGTVEAQNPVRGARCQTCGATINPNGTVEYDAVAPLPYEDVPALPDWAAAVTSPEAQDELSEADEVVFVDAIGRPVDIDGIRAVVLTIREHQLFDMADYGRRAEFAAEHGMTVQQYFG